MFSTAKALSRKDLGLSSSRKFAFANFSKSLAAFTVKNVKVCDFAAGKFIKT